MDHEFDAGYWESHWQEAGARTAGRPLVPNPHLLTETAGLTPGTALDAGCGEGAEAAWLAGQGWRVTGADVSAEALARAAARTTEPVRWVQADLGTWAPAEPVDLVTTHYAHPAMPQLDFYRRVAGWVAQGGTLLIVGHAGHHGHGHGEHPAEVSVTPATTVACLDPDSWDVVTAEERTRRHGERELTDVVVRATRRA